MNLTAPSTPTPIQQSFLTSRAARRLQLMPFVPAGYPSLAATAALLPALANAGAGLIEVGIPFSDPVADGPVIQAAFTAALAQKIKLADILATVKAAKPHTSAPLVAMVSYSIAFRRGIERFAADLRDAGFDGLILPDLPPPEAQSVTQLIQSAGLDTVLLVAPTTPDDRRRTIADLSSGFLYYLSIAGITGERATLPPDLQSNLANLRKLTTKPLCVGFGLGTRDHLQALKGHADGAIVGSALVKRITAAGPNPQAIAQAAAHFCHELLGN